MAAESGGPPTTDELLRATLSAFDELVEADAFTRSQRLQALARARPELHRKLVSLLSACDAAQSSAFLDGPKPSAAASEPSMQFQAGMEFGVYRLSQPLGRGGMGEVWLGHRTDGVHDAPVALKLLHAHLSIGSGRERFAREGRILASLSHSHIARLFDAGVGAQGQRYLVIEYIDGERIDRWCDARTLGIEARVRLFLQICQAVAYAHSHLVVHRDLKPGNILVTAEGSVKLLDFGIAKLIENEHGGLDTTELTRPGSGALTPDYAAPEQLLGEAVTTATDVYALGVILHVLLTGRHPYERGGRAAMAQLAMDLLHAEPRKPSEVVTDDTSDSPTKEELATRRAATCSTLRRGLAGDLDAIIRKALRKEPEARYADARAFADDLDRYLRHEPVHAREGARAYVWRRFIRRNWMPLSATAGSFLVLVAGITGIAWEAQRARHEAMRANSAIDFLVGIFRASDPRIAQDKPRGQMTVRDLMDQSADRINTQFLEDPETQIKLLGISADIYRELDETERFKIFRAQQIELAKQAYGELDQTIIESLLDDASTMNEAGNESQAEAFLQQIDQLIHGAHMDNTVARARWMAEESYAVTPRDQNKGEYLIQNAVRLYEHIGASTTGYPRALALLSSFEFRRGDYSTSELHRLRAISVLEKDPHRNNSSLLENYVDLGDIYEFDGNLGQAEFMYGNAIVLASKTYGEQSSIYWNAVASQARTLHQHGERERAEQLLIHLRRLIPAHVTWNMHSAIAQTQAAATFVEDGHPIVAIPMLEEVELYCREKNKKSGTLVSLLAEFLGDSYDLAGRTEDARQYLKSAVDLTLAIQPPDGDLSLNARERWGRFLIMHGDPESGESELREVLTQSHDRVLSSTVLAWADLAQLAILRHDAAGAMQASSHALQLLDHVTGLFDVRTSPYVWRIHAEALLAAGDLETAHDWAARAVEADIRYDGADSLYVAQAQTTLKSVDEAMRLQKVHH